MREARTGVAILGGQLKTGFGTLDDFSPLDIARAIAELYAAGMRSGVRAFAKASGDGGRTKNGGRIGGGQKEWGAKEAREEGSCDGAQDEEGAWGVSREKHGAIVSAIAEENR